MGPKPSRSGSRDDEGVFLLFGFHGNESEILVFCPQQRTFQKLRIPQGLVLRRNMAILTLSGEQIYISGGISDEGPVAELINFNPVRNTAILLAPMIFPRYNHSLTFKDGMLYAIGGQQADSLAQRTCERYNPKANRWTRLEDMSLHRTMFNTLIYDGQIYVFGGYKQNSKLTKKIELYDDITNHWVILKLRLSFGVEGAFLQPFSDQELLILGGTTKQGVISTGQLLDIVLHRVESSVQNTLRVARHRPHVFFGRGSRYVLAGDDDLTCEFDQELLQHQLPKRDFKSYVSNSLVCTLPSTQPPAIPMATIQENIISKLNDRIASGIVVFGETTAAIIDLQSGTSQLLNLPSPLFLFMGGIKLNENTYLVIGGVNKNMNHISGQTSHLTVENKSISIVPWSSMNQVRYAFGTCIVKNTLIVCGGRHYGGDDQAVLPSAEKLDLSKGREAMWQSIAPMNERRCSHMCFEFKEKVYAVGGYRGNQQREDSIEVYEPEQDRWLLLGISLHASMEASLLFNLSDEQSNKIEILIVGGRRQQGDTDEIESFAFQLDAELDDQTPVITSYGKLEQKMCMMKVPKMTQGFQGVKSSPDEIFIVGKSLQLTATRFSLKTKQYIQSKGDKKIKTMLSSGEFATQPIGKFLVL